MPTATPSHPRWRAPAVATVLTALVLHPPASVEGAITARLHRASTIATPQRLDPTRACTARRSLARKGKVENNGGDSVSSPSPPLLPTRRRRFLLPAALLVPLASGRAGLAATGGGLDWDRQVSGAELPSSVATNKAIQEAYDEARKAYAELRLDDCIRLYDVIVSLDPESFVWYERRAQVLVDANRFREALSDFERAQKLRPANYISVGLLANRGLAHEGLFMWEEALKDYDEAISVGKTIGNKYPYILNSRGNVHSALGEWSEARADYLESARIFQESRILSSAIFASGNAALALAQLGQDDQQAIRELQAAARRGPASIDFRAAIAALKWEQGQRSEAATLWRDACRNIRSGTIVAGGPSLDSCGDFTDSDWLSKIRRWPPRLIRLMRDFLQGLEEFEDVI